MPDDPNRLPSRWEALTPLGRLIYLGGAAARAGADVLDGALQRAATIVHASHQAFLDGRDGGAHTPRIEEAHVVREQPRGAGGEGASPSP